MAVKLPGFLNPAHGTGAPLNGLLSGLRQRMKGRHWMLITVLGLAAFGIMLLPRITSPQPQPETAIPGSDTIGTAALALSVLFKLAFVILLIYVSLYLLKRYQTGKIIGSPKKLSILETTHLSPRQALHLVQVGGRVFLIGATDQSISCLVQVESPPPPEGERKEAAETLTRLDELVSLGEDGEQVLPGQPQALPGFASIFANAFGKR